MTTNQITQNIENEIKREFEDKSLLKILPVASNYIRIIAEGVIIEIRSNGVGGSINLDVQGGDLKKIDETKWKKYFRITKSKGGQ